jgi:hypothetical protein
MQISISRDVAVRPVGHDGTPRVLLLGTRLASHNLFDWCCRLLERPAGAVHIEQLAAAGLRRAWTARGTLAVLNAGWSLVVMLEDTLRIAEEPDRYASIARVLSFAARSSGARVALVQPPPRTPGGDGWARVRHVVDGAARAAHAGVVRVGDAWRLALARQPGLPLHAADGEVTTLGAYLAACAIARYVAGDAVAALDVPGAPRGSVGAVHLAVEEAVADGRDRAA